ncbi:type VI secretion system protein ImpB [Noviherbaspirillum humi]|uniref:Type VI secretion system protein ImpB n=2 Tax=Noviherbaspirillum humi TaxID=1688639 RepID=A0A239DLI7_9BURK|nr:type VI secretion system contractile sheath small subunit [Noviherbaspirillum humi]SNS32494.1 type VI secretion system protein ImpB [Noviherbaspirillum humi]
MAKESTQKKLSRVRPPRVQITYDVEVGDALETKELPFVLGVLGEFAGQPAQALPKLKERKFVEIDRDNFDEVLKGMAPRLQLDVDNRLAGDDSRLRLALNFSQLRDFEPDRIVEQVEPLRQLLEIRSRLFDLRNRMAGNDKLEEMLDEIVRDTDKLRQIQADSVQQEE